MTEKYYVTFTYRKQRYGVECFSEEQAQSIAMDANSVLNFDYVYIRKSDRPRKAIIISVEEYNNL